MPQHLHDLLVPSLPLWNLILRTVIVYIAVLMLLRLSGKRQVANLGTSELVALLLISNAVQNSMNGGDNSLTGGLVLAAVLMVMSFILAALTYFSRDWERFIQGRPTLLIHHGVLQRHNLRRELLNVRELRAQLRKQGIQNIAEVDEAVLESDGYISVVRKIDARDELMAEELTEQRQMRR
ncbi:MAG: DUF421 domain-containing protein [Anaerolineae bacterium]|nr:DUF421 domain-containing protein [Phycisphaerae bacterium]